MVWRLARQIFFEKARGYAGWIAPAGSKVPRNRATQGRGSMDAAGARVVHRGPRTEFQIEVAA